MKAPAITVAVALVIGPGAAQRFRSGIDVVRVDALVTDGDRAVSGLTARDFDLRDNGVPQQIDSVSVDDVPVSMMLALDTSHSVEGETLRELREAATIAVDSLTELDRCAVLTFGNLVRLQADWGAPSPGLRESIASTRAAGTTSLYDAAFAALTMRDAVPGTRALIVLFSDGTDTSSWLPPRAILERARRTDAVVYVVTRGTLRPEARLEYRSGIELWRRDGHPSTASPHVVAELATLTGGNVFVAARANRLREAFTRIVTEFRSRYLITYTPHGADAGGWHAIDLQLKHRRGTVRARRGYFR